MSVREKQFLHSLGCSETENVGLRQNTHGQYQTGSWKFESGAERGINGGKDLKTSCWAVDEIIQEQNIN